MIFNGIMNMGSSMPTITKTIFCLSGTKSISISPGQTVTAHCSDKDTDISASQIIWWKVDKFYEELKKGSHIVRISDETFICPYCPKMKKQRYVYRELLEHAFGVAHSSSEKRSVREKETHLALVRYLKKDLRNVTSPSKPVNEGDSPVKEAIILKLLFKFSEVNSIFDDI